MLYTDKFPNQSLYPHATSFAKTASLRELTIPVEKKDHGSAAASGDIQLIRKREAVNIGNAKITQMSNIANRSALLLTLEVKVFFQMEQKFPKPICARQDATLKV